MRTIKFRGFNAKNNQWLYGSHILNRGKHFVAPDEFANGKTWEDYEVEEESIGQFTGLTDFNSKEIYEGDILLWTRKNVHIEGRPLQDFSDKCIVYYDNDKCAFQFRCELRYGACVGYLDFDDDRADESFVEVIGNIHDNPELIKEGGEQ